MKSPHLIVLVFLLSTLLATAQKRDAVREPKFPDAQAHKTAKLTYRIIEAPNGTYAYDIYSDDKLFIHQPSVPGLPGNEGFKTKSAAEHVALLVVDKIAKGQMPPTVSLEEMKKLKAIP